VFIWLLGWLAAWLVEWIISWPIVFLSKIFGWMVVVWMFG